MPEMPKNQENSLKLVESGGTAGGFAGRTSFAYLADVKTGFHGSGCVARSSGSACKGVVSG